MTKAEFFTLVIKKPEGYEDVCAEICAEDMLGHSLADPKYWWVAGIYEGDLSEGQNDETDN